jgi:hypothetical protein
MARRPTLATKRVRDELSRRTRRVARVARERGGDARQASVRSIDRLTRPLARPLLPRARMLELTRW